MGVYDTTNSKGYIFEYHYNGASWAYETGKSVVHNVSVGNYNGQWIYIELTIANDEVVFDLKTSENGTLIHSYTHSITSSNNLAFGLVCGHTSGARGWYKNIKAKAL